MALLGGESARTEIAQKVASLHDKPTEVKREIAQWLEAFNDLLETSEALVSGIKMKLDPIRQDLDHLAELIRVWGAWMVRQELSASPSSPETENLQNLLQKLQEEQVRVLHKGTTTKAHFEHLMAVEVYVRDSWSKDHADTCPTCGADYANHGGIFKVVQSLREQTAAERESLRNEYSRLKVEIERVQKQLVEFGVGECPVNVEEQSRITESFQWLIPSGIGIAEWIRDKNQRELLIKDIAALRSIPSLPGALRIDYESERVQQSIVSQFEEADRTFDEPNNWRPVKTKLTETLAGIVRDHLPNTLAKLWCEIALNLTSAPWLLPERPSFEVISRRGEQRSTVRVKDRLARYILNQSEIHVLGLAWFFTSYLTRSRFFHACMVMDDPAQELDQTSFRDLCRLWETIVRLHKVYKRPLKLILMLNQENRAVEAARATSGVLYVLDWARDQERSIRKISVVGEGFYAPEPTSLFEKTG